MLLDFPVLRADMVRYRRVLLRLDLNLPWSKTHFDTTRLERVLPTIRFLLRCHSTIIILSHFGRPQKKEEVYSLRQIHPVLQAFLNQKIIFLDHWLSLSISSRPGEVFLCENTRFQAGERDNDLLLSQKIAAMADVMVMDALSVAHRLESSVHGAFHLKRKEHLCSSCIGFAFHEEMQHLKRLIGFKGCKLALVGGSKLSTKLPFLKQLIQQGYHVCVGGELIKVVQSSSEIEGLKAFMSLPQDVVVYNYQGKKETKALEDLAAEDVIADIGPIALEALAQRIQKADIIIWNGPFSWYENPLYQWGTYHVARMIAMSHAYTVAGGGSTVAAIKQFHLQRYYRYISTGGGAFLHFLSYNNLPFFNSYEA